jgi:hypothetical protein
MFLNDNYMKACYSTLKEKMLELTRLFYIEHNIFQKLVIIYQYITLIDKDPITKKILQKLFDNTVSHLGECADNFNEDKFLKVKSDVIRTREFWTYYFNLKSIYSHMKDMKDCNLCNKEELEDLFKLFSRPYSASSLKLSFKIINGNIFEELEQTNFLDKDKKKGDKVLSFDEKHSLLYIKDFKIVISKQLKETNDHKILKHIFITNKGNLSDEFYYSEIAQDEFGELEYKTRKNNWRKYSRTCEYLNDKIKKETKDSIKNFLIFNSGSKGMLKINPQYL